LTRAPGFLAGSLGSGPALAFWTAVARWTQDSPALPDRNAMLERMTAIGRTSKVRYPTVAHAAGRTAPDGRAPQPGLPMRPR
jgi:hypothetical protein